jgi:hypothetical protein
MSVHYKGQEDEDDKSIGCMYMAQKNKKEYVVVGTPK